LCENGTGFQSLSSKALSYYATPGARAIGSLGTIPNEVDAYGGLTMAERAVMPDGRVLEPKTFTQAQYRNAKWGDEVEMATFLVLAILCFEEKPDVVIIYGIWVHDKDGDDSNFSLFYDANGLMRDPLTRQTIQGMGKDRLILDANWPDTIRMTDLDPSILVAPSGQGSMADPDHKVISAVARKITYGGKKTKSFLRVEALPTDHTYTMDALVGLFRKPSWLVFPKRRIGPSGIAPVQQAFAPVLPNAWGAASPSPAAIQQLQQQRAAVSAQAARYPAARSRPSASSASRSTPPSPAPVR